MGGGNQDVFPSLIAPAFDCWEYNCGKLYIQPQGEPSIFGGPLAVGLSESKERLIQLNMDCVFTFVR